MNRLKRLVEHFKDNYIPYFLILVFLVALFEGGVQVGIKSGRAMATEEIRASIEADYAQRIELRDDYIKTIGQELDEVRWQNKNLIEARVSENEEVEVAVEGGS